MKAWLRLTLVVTTVGGGFAGIIFHLEAIQFWFNGQRKIEWVPIVLFLAVNVFVMASGLIFVQDSHRTRPLRVALGLQIPRISSSLLVYAFSAGLNIPLDVAVSTTDGAGPALRFGGHSTLAPLRRSTYCITIH